MPQTPRKRPNRGKYSPKLINEVDRYLKQCKDKTEEFHQLRSLDKNGYERLKKVDLPTVEGFAKFVDIPRRTLYDWRNAHKDFDLALDKIVMEQKIRLINGGLSGEYSPGITKLILATNHDMVEKSDITSGGKPIPLMDYTQKSKEE